MDVGKVLIHICEIDFSNDLFFITGRWFIGDTFITKTGYLPVAELNNLIIFFPQITPTKESPENPWGCWDWWGANSPEYTIKTAPQMAGVMKMLKTVRMINRAISGSIQQ